MRARATAGRHAATQVRAFVPTLPRCHRGHAYAQTQPRIGGRRTSSEVWGSWGTTQVSFHDLPARAVLVTYARPLAGVETRLSNLVSKTNLLPSQCDCRSRLGQSGPAHDSAQADADAVNTNAVNTKAGLNCSGCGIHGPETGSTSAAAHCSQTGPGRQPGTSLESTASPAGALGRWRGRGVGAGAGGLAGRRGQLRACEPAGEPGRTRKRPGRQRSHSVLVLGTCSVCLSPPPSPCSPEHPWSMVHGSSSVHAVLGPVERPEPSCHASSSNPLQ